MRSHPLESKTVRPGSLGAYSYYHSNRRPDHPPSPAFIASHRAKLVPKKLILAAVVIVALIFIPLLRGDGSPKKPVASQSGAQKAAPAAAMPAGSNKTNHCSGNALDKLVVVSVSQRHLWACEKAKTVYNAPVITGISSHEETLTPAGTYKIYSKQTDTVLTGSDVTGSWNDPVSYWMPFLANQYGVYGFHDATWRSNDEFGKVSPDSDDASHGCVELPLEASAWLYKWAHTGTTVTIKD
jgi:lipoprotein-anchoring transpeptidase ErfK/SrfK